MFKRFIRNEDGQGMTEYAVILALIVIIAVTLVLGLQEQLDPLFTRIVERLSGVLS